MEVGELYGTVEGVERRAVVIQGNILVLFVNEEKKRLSTDELGRGHS